MEIIKIVQTFKTFKMFKNNSDSIWELEVILNFLSIIFSQLFFNFYHFVRHISLYNFFVIIEKHKNSANFQNFYKRLPVILKYNALNANTINSIMEIVKNWDPLVSFLGDIYY